MTDSADSAAVGGTEGVLSAKTAASFADVTGASGVKFTYRNGEEAGVTAILESLGGGVGLFDYDGDGHLDIFFPGGGEFGSNEDLHGLSSALFRSDGKLHFDRVSESAGVTAAPYYSHGASIADYDNDGFPDILVTGYGGLLLFHNAGDGTFQEVGRALGLVDTLWSSSAAWGDFNGDGDLDLYVAHYVDWSFAKHPYCETDGKREYCPPRSFEALPDTLYTSNGDGSFRDVSEDAGLTLTGADVGKGLGVLVADFELDGDLDIYVANDTVPNLLYRNNGQGEFVEFGLQSGASLSESGVPDGSMGVDLGDFNLDGLPDLWVANYENESLALYRNEGDCFFQHVSQATGVTAVGGLFVSWGTVFLDFDRDGDEDVFVSNGHVIRYPPNAPVLQKPLLFENDAGKRFANVASAAGPYLTADHMGRGVAVGDLDNDGDLDLVVTHTNEPVTILSNESANSHHWLSLKLIGISSNRDAVGAIVSITTAKGQQTRQVKTGGSYASTNDPRLFFGLGEESIVERLEVRWPSGVKTELSGVSCDRVLQLIEPRE